MNSNSFVVTDYYELRAMQRVFREAKFCIEPDDEDVSGSPIVARLFNRLMEALIATQVEIKGDHARQQWVEWLTIDDSRDEWRAAMKRAKKEQSWIKWTDEERRSYVKDLLSPFIVSEDLVEHFIVGVGDNVGDNGSASH